MVQYTDEQIAALISREYAGQKLLLMAPLVQNRKGHYKELFDSIRKKGFLYARVDGEVVDIVQGMKVDRYKNHTIEVVVDRIRPKGNENENENEDFKRLRQSIDKAMTQGGGVMAVAPILEDGKGAEVRYFSRTLMDPVNGLS